VHRSRSAMGGGIIHAISKKALRFVLGHSLRYQGAQIMPRPFPLLVFCRALVHAKGGCAGRLTPVACYSVPIAGTRLCREHGSERCHPPQTKPHVQRLAEVLCDGGKARLYVGASRRGSSVPALGGGGGGGGGFRHAWRWGLPSNSLNFLFSNESTLLGRAWSSISGWSGGRRGAWPAEKHVHLSMAAGLAVEVAAAVEGSRAL